MPLTNPVTPYPQASPTISGVNVTASVFLQSPARVQRAITDFTVERFIMDRIFSQGPTATGGAVVYDQVLGTFFFLDRDVQEIRPGSQFPILAGGEQLPSVAVVRKLGGEVMLTDEAVRRDNRDLLGREMRRLGNNVIRYVDAAAVAALNAAPILTMTAASSWTTAGSDPLADIATAAELIYGPDLGYHPDAILMNPMQHASAIKNTTLRTALPRENLTDSNPIFGGHLNMLEGLDIFLTNRVPVGTMYVLQSKQVGSYSEEIPEYYKPIYEPRHETTYIHGARITVPYVTDPLCCVKVTGL
jgi:hypothetical protein